MTDFLLAIWVLLVLGIIYFLIARTVGQYRVYNALKINDWVLVFDSEGCPIDTHVVAKEPERICLSQIGWVTKHDFIFGGKDGTDYYIDYGLS